MPKIAERFVTAAGRTGVALTIPSTWQGSHMPILEALAREFMMMGGEVYSGAERIAVWREARFPLGVPLFAVWQGSAQKTYDALPPQPTAGDLAGQGFVFFIDIAQEVETSPGASFDELMERHTPLACPLAWLALLLSLPDPAGESSYPSQKHFEWVGALAKQAEYTCALGGRSRSDGLRLGWDGPEGSDAGRRARSVVRSTAGWVDLDLAWDLAGPGVASLHDLS